MTDAGADDVRAGLERFVGQPLSAAGPAVAPDPVNVPMVRHWVDALDDRNPVYLDEQVARTTAFGTTVAPPAMLQTWTMARPQIEGIAARGGAATEISGESVLGVLADAGYTATLATNSELEFLRYLRVGDHLSSSAVMESISERTATALGAGYFVTWVSTYVDQEGEPVGRQRFRVFRFAPGTAEPRGPGAKRSAAAPGAPTRPGEELPPFRLDVTATVVVAGAIASRDFMPAHHDRDYARGQGVPDLFMNILTTNGYVSRYVTDWAGPHAVLRTIDIRLGGPVVPGSTLSFTGAVQDDRRDETGRRLEVAVRAATETGDHASATVVLTLPG